MSRETLRIGIVGAGRIVKERHAPGFRAIPGVELVGVCNRHRGSTARAARELGIPKTYGNWEDLAGDPDIDAVVIGAWPYLHCPVTLAALGAGKHVLTQARMAMNAREAQRMLDRSRAAKGLVSMIVPSPLGLTGEAFLKSLLDRGQIGELRELHVDGLGGDLADPSTPLGWRQKTRFSGFNMLNLGILYETVLRFAPPANQVMARASKVIPTRPDPESGKPSRVGTADSIQALTTQEDGSVGVYRLSAVVWREPSISITFYGSEGTIIYDLLRDEIRGMARGESTPRLLPIPEASRGGWRVEADFVAAIRGERPVTHTDFETGARYMQFTEAVARSSRHQVPVHLPLREFSNPSL